MGEKAVIRAGFSICDKIYRRWRNNRALRPNRPSVAVAGSGTTSLLVEKFTADKYMPSQEFRILFL